MGWFVPIATNHLPKSRERVYDSPDAARIAKPKSCEMDVSKCNALKAELGAQPEPQIAVIDRFFDGNDDLGSIGCNLVQHPLRAQMNANEPTGANAGERPRWRRRKRRAAGIAQFHGSVVGA